MSYMCLETTVSHFCKHGPHFLIFPITSELHFTCVDGGNCDLSPDSPICGKCRIDRGTTFDDYHTQRGSEFKERGIEEMTDDEIRDRINELDLPQYIVDDGINVHGKDYGPIMLISVITTGSGGMRLIDIYRRILGSEDGDVAVRRYLDF